MAVAWGLGVWIMAGMIGQQWWIQFACFVVSTFIMVELNNSNALIRIYSRMVSTAFIFMTCAACFLFHSTAGAIAGLSFVAGLYTFFKCYQDKLSTGWTFYTFLLISLGSLAIPQMLWLVPLLWLLMIITIYSMSWRTFSASMLGLVLPYLTYVTGVLLFQEGDFTQMGEHMAQLVSFTYPVDYMSYGLPGILVFALVSLLTLTGIIHYLRTSFHDKIRIRQLFYTLMFIYGYASLLLVVQPQQADLLLRVMIISGSPLIGHFISLTSTKVTNIAFIGIIILTVLITGFNLWMLLSGS